MREASLPTSPPPQLRNRANPGPRTVSVWVAFCFPLLGAVTQIRGDELWRTDAAVLAAMNGPTGLQGTLSALISQFALAFPLGSQAFRLALPAALFSGIAGVAALKLAHLLFRKQGGYSKLDSWLILGASLSVSFSLPWMSEATVAGGASVGAAIGLTLVGSILSRGLPRTLIGAAFAGVALGALISESAWAAAAVFLAAILSWGELTQFESFSLKRFHRAPVFRATLALVSAVGCFLCLSLPLLFSRGAESWATASQATESQWPLWSPLDWTTSIGLLWCGGALLAALFSLQDRRPLYALLAIIGADFLAPGSATIGWTTSIESGSGRMALHLLALGLTAPLGALGLRTLAESAHAMRLFAARPLAALIAVLAIAGCLASAEDTLRSLEQTGSSGTQTWTDEALDRLPEKSLVFTQSLAWGRRLLATQALGARPDILVVPMSHVADARSVHEWLAREPALEVLLRDLSTSATPSERAITQLVDVRPVFLEPNENWDRRLLEHVRPAVPLAEFSPHALGRSDRLSAIEVIPDRIGRIEESSERGLTPEIATAEVLRGGIQRSVKALEMIKDGASKRALETCHPETENPLPLEEKSSPPLAQVTK